MNNFFNPNNPYPSNNSYQPGFGFGFNPYPPNGNPNIPNPPFSAFEHNQPYPPSQNFPSTTSIEGGFPVAPSNNSPFNDYNNPPHQISYPSPPQPSYPLQPFSSQQYTPPPHPSYPAQPNNTPSFPLSTYEQNNYPAYPQNTIYNQNEQNYTPVPNFNSNINQTSNKNIYPNLNSLNTTYTTTQPFNPTLRPYQPFDPSQDAQRLYKAMKGFGTDETTLIDVLCNRTSDQRQQIALMYKTSYGKDLIKNIESETSGFFEKILVSLLRRPMMLEAMYLRESIQGFSTNEEHLIDVLCTKTPSEMIELKNTYMQVYRRNIEDDVKDDVSGYFKRFLVSLMTGNRSTNPPDTQRASHQARELYQAGEGRLGTNEMVFNRIFCSESFAHLRLVFQEYQRICGHPIETAIRNEMSTSVQRAFLTLIQIIRSPPAYYAQRLYESMKGLGTKDRVLIRIMVLRSEIDMQDIKNEFQRMYGKNLESFIKGDTSGDYKRALLCLAGTSNWK